MKLIEAHLKLIAVHLKLTEENPMLARNPFKRPVRTVNEAGRGLEIIDVWVVCLKGVKKKRIKMSQMRHDTTGDTSVSEGR